MADSVKIVNNGISKITALLSGANSALPKWVGWGTGITPPVEGNTTLETPASESRYEGEATQQTSIITNDTFQIVATITCSGSSKAITEVGIFDASENGNMFLRGTFSTINVNSGDSITFTIKSVFSQV